MATEGVPAGTESAPPPRPPSLRGRILLHSGIQLSGKAFSALGGVVLLWLLTRYLGPSGFGSYTFVTGYVALFGVITDLGFQSIAVRDMARSPTDASRIVGQLFTLKLLLSLLAIVVVVGVALIAPAAPFRIANIVPAIIVCSLGLISAPFLASGIAIFQTALNMTIPALADALSRLVGLGIVMLLVVGAPLVANVAPGRRLVLVVAAGTVAASAGALLVFVGSQRNRRFTPVFDRSLALTMLRDAFPLGVFFVLGLINFRIDIIILSVMRGMHDVGLYGIASRMLDVALGGAVIFSGLALPVLSERAARDPELLERAFQKAFDLMLIVGVGAAVFVSILASPLILLLAGDRFHGAFVPLAIIAWAIPITFAETILVQMIVTANRQARAAVLVLAVALINIILNIILIPRMGPAAPSLVTCISDGVSLTGFLILVARYSHVKPNVPNVGRVLIAAAAAALALLLLRSINPILALGLGLAVYPGALFMLRVVGPDDVRALLGPAK